MGIRTRFVARVPSRVHRSVVDAPPRAALRDRSMVCYWCAHIPHHQRTAAVAPAHTEPRSEGNDRRGTRAARRTYSLKANKSYYPYDRVRGGSGGRGDSRVRGGRVRFISASFARTRASWCAARASTYSSRNVGRSHLPSCHRSRTARDLCGTQMSGAPRHRRDSLDTASDVWSHSRARAS